MFQLKNYTFTQRIFGSMILMVLFTSVSISYITIIHFRNQTSDYHHDRLDRKVDRAFMAMEYELDNFPEEIDSTNVKSSLSNKIYGISRIHDMKINIYSMSGKMILTSDPDKENQNYVLNTHVIDSLRAINPAPKNGVLMVRKRLEMSIKETDNLSYFEIFGYLYNIDNQPIAIVNLPYHSDNSFFQKELLELLQIYGWAMLFIFMIGILLAWVMSLQITRRVKDIAHKLKNTQVITKNNPLRYENKDEVKVLVDSYNEMLGKLKEQSELMAKTEREDAWREMAKQVAHEVKNPLTPMRLMIQQFQMKLKTNSPENCKVEFQDLSESLIHQIDAISKITEAFSDFAKMPDRADEKINLVKELDLTVDTFSHLEVDFIREEEEIFYEMDKTYFIRIMNNLLKNAKQAVNKIKNPKISVAIEQLDDKIHIAVKDNGEGIPEAMKSKIFQPNFTTKSGGMGLGLAMSKKIVEDYDGKIYFESQYGEGTTFHIEFPI